MPISAAVTGHSFERVSIEGDFSLVELIQAREAIEERGFAGAIGADQAGDLALGHFKTDAIQGHDAAKANTDAANGEQGGNVCDGRCRNRGSDLHCEVISDGGPSHWFDHHRCIEPVPGD